MGTLIEKKAEAPQMTNTSPPGTTATIPPRRCARRSAAQGVRPGVQITGGIGDFSPGLTLLPPGMDISPFATGYHACFRVCMP